MGLAGIHDWRFRDAEAAYRKAIELEPRYATAHQWYGELLFHTARLDSSLAEIEMSGELDPLAPIHPAALGYALYLDGQFDSAIAVLKKGIEIAPTLALHHAMLGGSYIMKSRFRDAIAEIETAARLAPDLAMPQGHLAYAYARGGNEAKAREIVAKLNAIPEPRRPQVVLAIAYLGLKENANAIAALERAVAAHDITLLTSATLLTDPIYDPIRNDPRFEALLVKMNLQEYARPR
jgi:tetratricopeptide (TPR) repeat protein